MNFFIKSFFSWDEDLKIIVKKSFIKRENFISVLFGGGNVIIDDDFLSKDFFKMLLRRLR